MMTIKSKVCNHCERRKPLDEFYPSGRSEQTRPECIACTKAIRRAQARRRRMVALSQQNPRPQVKLGPRPKETIRGRLRIIQFERS
jgi:hypothetical protein